MRNILQVSILAASLAATACTEHVPAQLGEPFPISVPASSNSVGPRLAHGPNGDLILSWMEREKDATTLSYSLYEPGGWRPALAVVTEPKMFVNWADRPAVTPLGGGSLFAHWLRYSADTTYAYDVVTSRSSDAGKTWTDSSSPHEDGTPTEHGFVSVFPAEGGTGLIWLDGRKMVNEASDGPMANGMTLRGATVGSDGSLSDEQILDELVCDCCQTDVAVSDQGPVAIYRDRTADEVRDVYVSRHLDGRWQPGVPVSADGWVIAGCPVNGPAIVAEGDLVVAAWFSAPDGKPIVQTAISKNAGKTFAEPVIIATSNAQGSVGLSLIDANSYAVSWLKTRKDGPSDINIRTVTVDGKTSPVLTVARTDVSRNVPQMRRVDDILIIAWSDKIGDANKVLSIRVPILGFYD